jgi:hypothetical protein
MRHRRMTALIVVSVGLLCLLWGCAAGAAAAAPPNVTWDGATGPDNPRFELWSGGNWMTQAADGNWTTRTLTNGESLGTLTFPQFPTCKVKLRCCPYTAACTISHDNLKRLSVQQIDIDSTERYRIGSNPGDMLDLSGGITAADANDQYRPSGLIPHISVPLALIANQSWSIQGNSDLDTGPGGLEVTDVTGAHKSLAIALSDDSHFDVLGKLETGPVTLTGSSAMDTGVSSVLNGTIVASDINGTSGAKVTLNRVALVDRPLVSGLPTTTHIGPLSVESGALDVYAAQTPDPILKVNGGITLDGNSVLYMDISHTGGVASKDFSQIQASGRVRINGLPALYEGGDSSGYCSLTTGATATLIKTSGTLTGTFTQAPDNGVVLMAGGVWCHGQQRTPVAELHYSRHAVTATVVPPATTAVALSATKRAAIGATVTLTAEVTAGKAFPQGTVAFLAGGKVIPGCTAEPIDGDSRLSYAYASTTCSTSFAEAGKVPITARFTPTTGSGLDDATSPSVTITVGQK